MCDPLSENPALPTIIEFELGDFIRTSRFPAVLQAASTVSYWIMKPDSATIKMLKAWTHRQVSEIQERVAMEILERIFPKNEISQAYGLYTAVFLSIDTM